MTSHLPANIVMGLLAGATALRAQISDDLVSQLAPTDSEQPETPPLPVELIDPSPHLPGLPGWVVLLTVAIALGVVALLVFLIKSQMKEAPSPRSSRNPFATAREQLDALRELPPETPLAEIATRISLALRQYLADSRSEAALYQTREEFLTDEQRLAHVPEPAKSETADFLGDLSSLQYSPPSTDPKQTEALIARGLTTLDSLARPETPATANDD